MWQIERDEAVAGAEKSAVSGKIEVAEDDEGRRAAIERDKQEQREKISRWKVHLVITYFFTYYHHSIMLQIISVFQVLSNLVCLSYH